MVAMAAPTSWPGTAAVTLDGSSIQVAISEEMKHPVGDHHVLMHHSVIVASPLSFRDEPSAVIELRAVKVIEELRRRRPGRRQTDEPKGHRHQVPFPTLPGLVSAPANRSFMWDAHSRQAYSELDCGKAGGQPTASTRS